jgi:hypothetical protein
MQLPQERDKETYPVYLWYRTSFEIEKFPSVLNLLIDGFSGKEHRIYINGNEINGNYVRSNLDAEIKKVSISEFAKEGNNIVAVRLTVGRRTDGILDLLKITGDFSLFPFGDHYKIVAKKSHIKIGDWTQQGYPFYSGTGIYRTEINIPENYTAGIMILEAEPGEDVLEIEINGIKKILPWHPYRLDISEIVHAGQNQINFKVTNTLINILEGVKKKSGLLKEPRILFYNKYEFDL